MAYDYEDDLPSAYPFEDVLESSYDLQWRIDRIREAERDPLNIIGHNELLANLGRVVDERTLRLYDLGATAYKILTLPELVGAEAGEDGIQDFVQVDAAIDIACALRKYDAFELLELADDATAFLCDDVPAVAKVVAQIAEVIYGDDLSELEKRRVWAGAGIMRSFRIMEQLNRAA